MLFCVRMDVAIPRDLDPAERDDVVARERAYSQELQRNGEWAHLWRIVGQYSNISIFDVESNARLHEILSGLPLFPYMRIEVTALTAHPSAI
ncbi:muconolactone Delta-isomerase [Nocardioides sp. L-11A]|uniref:muconolactone Delta-isomerase n=1 Tax=Nocardioides sp. L-11A TaxID=3043848 RepID=UPI00249A4085|nr:muconolactone Delta-isomerase [Nocardioides sp. L-11A]